MPMNSMCAGKGVYQSKDVASFLQAIRAMERFELTTVPTLADRPQKCPLRFFTPRWVLRSLLFGWLLVKSWSPAGRSAR